MNISRLTLIITFLTLTACGGGGGGGGDGSIDSAGQGAPGAVNSNEEGSTSTVSVDGDSVELEAGSDGFVANPNASKSLASLAAPGDHSFKASQLATISIASGTAAPCHLNIYSRYSIDSNNDFLPEGESKVIQAYSADCSYSGRLYAMNHWDTLLLEVIDSRLTGTSSYYELTIDAGSISVNIN